MVIVFLFFFTGSHWLQTYDEPVHEKHSDVSHHIVTTSNNNLKAAVVGVKEESTKNEPVYSYKWS